MASTHQIAHKIQINATPAMVWQQITQLDITAFRHPPYMVILGIPKPLRAEIVEEGLGGARIAYFAQNKRFTQSITGWEPEKLFSFTFNADPGFRVGHILDLADGPFRMTAGAYRITPLNDTVKLELESTYELHGLFGKLLYIPVRVVLNLFQLYLLRGIKANSERSRA